MCPNVVESCVEFKPCWSSIGVLLSELLGRERARRESQLASFNQAAIGIVDGLHSFAHTHCRPNPASDLLEHGSLDQGAFFSSSGPTSLRRFSSHVKLLVPNGVTKRARYQPTADAWFAAAEQMSLANSACTATWLISKLQALRVQLESQTMSTQC